MKLCPTCKLRYPDDATHCFVDRSVLIDGPDPRVGSLIAGRYLVEEVIGEGGMATVYRARSALQERDVAIKLFRKDLARDPRMRERFRREAINTRRLAHPNIIEILDEGDTDDGAPFLVMELLLGETLDSLLENHAGPLPLPRAIDLNLQIAEGLARAHDFEVVHRDLKPDNLYVVHGADGGDLVKILDFGIARSMHDPRLTGSGEVFGTPQYMAPERITSIDAGPAADLYALGVILFQCVTGRLPFIARDITAYLMKHLREAPPTPRSINPDLPPELDALILQCLEKDAAKRPVDAHALKRALQQLAGRFPRPKEPDTVPPPPITAPDLPRTHTTLSPLTPASLDRWQRRLQLFGSMLQRAFPGTGRPDLAGLLARAQSTLQQMTDIQGRCQQRQGRVDLVAAHAREAQARFGRAMDALGQDLSAARQRALEAHEAERRLEESLRAGSAPFTQLHAQIVGSSPRPTPELAALYRAGLEALERAMDVAIEHARMVSVAEQCENEARDLEFQINELRAQLARVSQTSEDDTREVQQELKEVGGELSALEQALIAQSSELAGALRGRPELDDLFKELEANAA